VNEKNNISDAELSLISAISGLDNKLEELDHNISLLSKENKNSSKNLSSDYDLDKRVKELEEKILKLYIENKPDSGKKYLNTLPVKGRFSNPKKGYVVAENLRLKRIETIEKSLNEIHKKFNEHSFQSNKTKEVDIDNGRKSNDSDITIPDEFYLRSKGIFFGFIFSIALVFLLIVVSSGTNIFI
tara:strand:+ start:580 stop:1134 length:555 start_codon:yes stop_codon:yes gene_type:complete